MLEICKSFPFFFSFYIVKRLELRNMTVILNKPVVIIIISIANRYKRAEQNCNLFTILLLSPNITATVRFLVRVK